MTPYPMTLLHDASCPICELDMNNLKGRNEAGRLRFIDISAPGFDPALYGRTLLELKARLHGVTADGRLIDGVEVFRLAYAAVGLGWVTTATGWPQLKPLADFAYTLFARHRPALAERFDGLWRHLLARQAVKRAVGCVNGVCKFPF